MPYFTEKKIKNLINNHNWELVTDNHGLYLLRQKDKHYMYTASFELPVNIVNKYLASNPV